MPTALVNVRPVVVTFVEFIYEYVPVVATILVNVVLVVKAIAPLENAMSGVPVTVVPFK